jgi:hypothetical protein
LAAFLAIPMLAAQLRLPVPRLDADAVEYFSHVRSLYFDHDLDFANEFEHFGILTRGDKRQPTITGHRRTIFSVGPALLWMPFYAAGDLVARAQGRVEDGYAPAHIRAVTLGSLAYGVAGLLLLASVLTTLVPATIARLTVLALGYGTFLYWYMVHEAAMSHALSFFMAAVVLRLWWTSRSHLSLSRALLLGLCIGLAATVRWQNGVLLLLPAATLLRTLRADFAPSFRAGAATLAAFAVGATPQMLAWKAIFGAYLLADPPHGRDFLRLDHPYLLETFFSSRHGLLYWTPLLWTGFLGYFLLLRRDRFAALATGVPLLVMSYVNVCSGDWWAGGSFSNRRFDSVLPLLALGMAVSFAWFARQVARRPLLPLAVAAFALTVWNGLFMEQYRRNLIPRDDAVSFAVVAENSATLLSGGVGTPVAWPANFVFAYQHDAPLAKYDLAVGQYLFYRQNNLGGVIDLGNERGDPGLLLEGWARPIPCGDGRCRTIEKSARLLVPLDVPEALVAVVRARGAGSLALAINGRETALWPLEEDAFVERRVALPREGFVREMNELRLTALPGPVVVDRIVFERIALRGAR